MTVIFDAVAVVVCLVVGFGVGRIKNSAKLAAIKAELVKVEVAAEADVKKVIAAIKAKL